MPEVAVTNNHERSRYEAHLGDALAGFLEYQDRGSTVVLPHTEVDPAYEGKGVGGALAKFALDDLATGDASIVPSCPFVAAYIQKHPEYNRLVESGSSD